MDFFDGLESIALYILGATLFLGSLLIFLRHWKRNQQFVDRVEAILITLLCLIETLKKICCAILEWKYIADNLSGILFSHLFEGFTSFFDFILVALIGALLIYCGFVKKGN